QGNRGATGGEPVILQVHAAITAALPQERADYHVERAERQTESVALHQVRIRQYDRKLPRPAGHARPEEDQLIVFELHFQLREKARPLVIKALLAEAAGLDAAMMIEHRERIALLQHKRPLVNQLPSGDDVP